MSSISENPVGLSAIGEGAGSDALLDISPYAPLSISASDTVVFREAIRLNVTDPLELQITATSVLGRKVVYDDTGVITLSETGNAYEFPALSSETLAATGGDLGPVSQNAISDFQFDGGTNYFPSVGELVWNVETGIIKSVSRSSTGALEIAVSDNDDASEGITRPDGKVEYPWFRPAVGLDVETVPFKTIGATSVEYYFDTRAEITQDNPGIPVGPISLSSVSEEQFVGFNDFFPSIGELVWNVETGIIKSVSRSSTGALEIGAVDNDDASEGVLRQDGRREYPWFRPTFAIDIDVATFKTITATSVEYYFDTRAEITQDNPGIPVGPISLSSISEEQFVGFNDFFPSVGELIWNVETGIIKSVSRSSTGALEIGAVDNDDASEGITRPDGKVEYPWFRPAVGLDVETVPFKTIGAFSTEYKFDAAPGTAENAFAPLGVITENSIAELGRTVGQAQTIILSDIGALEISAVSTDVLDTAILEFEDVSTGVLEITADFTVGIAESSVAPLTVDALDTIGKTFVYIDDAVLGTTVAQGVVSISANIDQTPLVIAASDVVEKTITTVDNTALEFGSEAVVENAFSLDDNGALEVDASDDTTIFRPVIEIITDSASLEIDTTDAVSLIYDYPKYDIALETTANDTIARTFAYTDTGVFAKAGATSIETTSGSIDTTALIITGADAIANTFAYADSAVFVKLSVDETGNTFDIVDTTTVELAATDATEVVNTFNHPAALEISASSLESVSETSTGVLEVVGQDNIEQTFEYTDTGVFAKAGATSIEVTSGTVDTTALIITGADAIANTFAYADSAVFVKLVATDEDIVYDIQDTTNLQVAVDDVYERAVAVDNSADLETTASDTQRSSVSRVTQGALEVNANQLLGITEASFAPLQIAGDEQLGKTFVYQDTGVFRTIDASSTEISYNRDFTGELEIAGQDSIEQLFTYDDVGVFRAVAAFDFDTVRSITDTTALEIAGSDVFSQTTSRITQGALEVAVEGPHTFAINRSFDAPLEIAEDGTISVAYDYADTGVFAKLAADETAFTTNRDAIGELEIAAQEAIVQIFNTEDVAALGALVVSDQQIVFVFDTVTANLFSVLSDQSSTQNFVADPALELSDAATNSIAYTQPQDTVETVIDSISVVNKTFAYDDTAEFGLLGASDSENIFNFEYVEFNTFGATDDVDVVYNFGSEAPALEASDTATQSSTRQFADEVDFVTFVAASSEILVNIENEGILGFGVTDDVDIVYNFQPQAFIETTATDDIIQSVSRRTTAPLKVGSITNQYYYTKFKQIYANDTIEFSLKGDSNEMKVSGAVEVTGADKQTWIG